MPIYLMVFQVLEEGILYLLCANNKCCPISWSPTKIKMVVKSTLAAEALSLVDGLDNAFCVGSLFSEILYKSVVDTNPIEVFVDNKSLVQNVHSTTLVSEKRLRVNLADIQQSIERNEATLKWISSKEQLADCLTKVGAQMKRGVIYI